MRAVPGRAAGIGADFAKLWTASTVSNLGDGLDRRRLLVAVNLLRGAVLAGLAGTVWSGAVTVPMVYAALFLLGTGETLADTPPSRCCPASCPPASSSGRTPA